MAPSTPNKPTIPVPPNAPIKPSVHITLPISSVVKELKF